VDNCSIKVYNRKIMKGYVQIYTGEGKGKTTAALGLALRAAGADYKVFVGQFIKSGDYSEIMALGRFNDLVTVEQYGQGRFIKGKPSDNDKLMAQHGLKRLKKIISSGDYQVVIIDEGNVAVTCELISQEDLLELIDIRHSDTELIITGRGATPEVIARADLVTEMVPVKHYYKAGVNARVGIEK